MREREVGHAIVCPRAVMVHLGYAFATGFAMMRADRLRSLAFSAPSLLAYSRRFSALGIGSVDYFRVSWTNVACSEESNISENNKHIKDQTLAAI